MSKKTIADFLHSASDLIGTLEDSNQDYFDFLVRKLDSSNIDTLELTVHELMTLIYQTNIEYNKMFNIIEF